VADVPHFDVPFRIVKGQAAVNEQGSPEDLAACVFAVCASEPGQFFDLPDFGFPDLFGSQLPVDPSALASIIEGQEPRARLLAEVNPQLYDRAILEANIQVS